MKKRAIFIIPLVITAIISVFLDYTLFNVWDIVLRFGIFYTVGVLLMWLIYWSDKKTDEEIEKENAEKMEKLKEIESALEEQIEFAAKRFVAFQEIERKFKKGEDIFLEDVQNEMGYIELFQSDGDGNSIYRIYDDLYAYAFYFKNDKLINYNFKSVIRFTK